MKVKTAFSCRYCSKRYPGCHSECDTYKQEKAEHNRRKDEKFKRDLIESQVRQIKYAAIDSPKKHRIFKRNERK